MRLFRFVILGLALVGIACAVVVGYAFRNRNQLAQLVLSRINQSSGYNIVVSGTRVSFRRHLVVVLEHPRIRMGQLELARLETIRAIITYRSLVHTNGLPLYSLILDHPQVHIPATIAETGAAGIPRLDSKAIATLKWGLDALTAVTNRIEVNGATLTTEDNASLVDHLDATAYRQHRRPGNWPWLLNFDAGWQHAPLNGADLAGNVWLGGQTNKNADVLSAGRVWFRGLDLKGFKVAVVEVHGSSQGSLHFALNSQGDLNGHADIDIRQLVLQGRAFMAPIALGDYSLHTDYRAAPEQAYLSGFSVQHAGNPLLEGAATVAHPYDPARTLTLHASGFALSLPQAAAWLRSLRGVPAKALAVANRFEAGELTVVQAILDPNQPLRDWNAATIRNSLKVEATLGAGRFTPPPELKLPRIDHAEAAFSYSGATLEVRQGSAEIGKTSVADASIQAGLKDAPRHVRYTTRLKGELDLDELYPVVASVFRTAEPKLLERIKNVSGDVPIEVSATGDLQGLTWRAPQRYRARLNLRGVQASVKGAPSAVAIKSGTATLQPEGIQIDKVVATFVAPLGGDAILNGRLDTSPQFPTPHQFSVELHAMPAAHWLPFFLDPDQLSAKGPIGGQIQINTDAADGGTPVVTGKLTLAPGEVQLGFLRSPIVTQSATLTLDGKGMEVSLPSSLIEGEPLQIKFTVPELAQPKLRIEAVANKLDFEVMRFVRLPWSRATPPHFFPIPVTGHVTVRAANFDKLLMSNVASDFSHDSNVWNVSNFTARAFGGRVDMNIAGRAADNWIQIKGTVAGMNAHQLTELIEPVSPPLTGELYAKADLRADSDVDFFDTLSGNATIEVRDGTLNRFVLLTRILSLIDLKSWLTAHLPNPMVAGVPFKSLTGDFKAKNGNFHTDNLKLEGPVMSASARGDLKLGSRTLNMRIGLVPFTTVNWIVRKIPIMGENLSNGSSGLLAAYFQVHGPVSNPTVTPKPITSVANFVIKTLSLPINIIAPNTVHP